MTEPDGGFGGTPKFPRPSYVDALFAHHDEARGRRSTGSSTPCRAGTLRPPRAAGSRATASTPMARAALREDAQRSSTARAKLLPGRTSRRDRAGYRRGAQSHTVDFVRDNARPARDSPRRSTLTRRASRGHTSPGLPTRSQRRSTSPRGRAVGRDAQRAGGSARAGELEGRVVPRLNDGAPSRAADCSCTRRRLARCSGPRTQPDAETTRSSWNGTRCSPARSGTVATPISSDEVSTCWDSSTDAPQEGEWWRTERRRQPRDRGGRRVAPRRHRRRVRGDGRRRWLRRAGDVARLPRRPLLGRRCPQRGAPTDGGACLSPRATLSAELIVRPKEVFDGATPSSHATACRSLARYAMCSDNQVARLCARRLVDIAADVDRRTPPAVPDLVEAAGFALGAWRW